MIWILYTLGRARDVLVRVLLGAALAVVAAGMVAMDWFAGCVGGP